MTTHEPAPPATGQPLWHDGWYRFARHLASPNHGPRPTGTQVSLVVIHAISLPPGKFGGGHVQQLFTNQLDWDAHPYFQSIRGLAVSAHFFIGRTGELWQFVSADARAWHAGVSSFRGQDNCNDYSIGIELEGRDDGPFEPAQYDTLASVCAAITAAYPVRDLTGHEHVAPGRKHDPGPGFEWPALQRALGWPDRCFPEPV